MNLAIFLDAHPICGEAHLLKQVKVGLFDLMNDNQILLARFTSAIESISTEVGWWNRLLTLSSESSGNRINLKKAGIFAIVHGIRSMALENHIWANSTEERAQALVQKNKLPKDLANDLTESLHVLMGLKLDSGLAELQTGKPVTGEVDMAQISSLERDLLKDSLNVVKSFKLYLRQHFRLDFA